MKRDWDLIRAILLALEKHPNGFAPDEIAIAGHDEETIGFHITLLIDAGLVVGIDVTSLGASSPQGKATRLTWQGYEFLDHARPVDRWEQAKKIVSRLGGATLEIWQAVLTDLVKRSLGI